MRLTSNGEHWHGAMACSVGYWFGEPYARNGYMAESVAAVLTHVFDTLRLHRVEAAYLPDNEASQRLLIKLEFHEEGLARCYLKIDGKCQDHRLFAILDADWRDHRLSMPDTRASATLAGD